MSLAPLSVCYNQSVFEDSVCNNHGTCANKTDAVCVCDGQYVKETYCLTTVSEELNGVNFPIYWIAGISYVVLMIVILYDFIVDFKLKVWPSLKRPIALGKISLFVGSAASVSEMVLFYIEHSANTNDYRLPIETMGFLSDFGIVITYSISALSWISVILTAKGLGKEQESLTHFRRYVIIANFVLLPIYFIVSFLFLLFPKSFALLYGIVVVLMILFYFSLIVGTFIFVQKAFRWIRSLDPTRRSATTERVKLKTYFLVGANIVGILRYVFLVYFVFTFDTVKLHLYGLILKLSQIILFAFFLLILENHVIRLPVYVRTGEIRSNTFLPVTASRSKATSKSRKRAETSTFELSSGATRDPSTKGEEEKRGKFAREETLIKSQVPSSSDSSSAGNLEPTSGSYSTSSSVKISRTYSSSSSSYSSSVTSGESSASSGSAKLAGPSESESVSSQSVSFSSSSSPSNSVSPSASGT